MVSERERGCYIISREKGHCDALLHHREAIIPQSHNLYHEFDNLLFFCDSGLFLVSNVEITVNFNMKMYTIIVIILNVNQFQFLILLRLLILQ